MSGVLKAAEAFLPICVSAFSCILSFVPGWNFLSVPTFGL